MHLALRVAPAVLCASLLLSCGDAPLGLTERLALARAEERWAARGFADYSFEYREEADLSPTERVRISVRGERSSRGSRLTAV